MREKEQKRELEEQIMKLTSQMISTERPTGADVNRGDGTRRPSTSTSPQRNTSALEIDERLADLERERECIEHDKAQVERYKQLLLKQRDIMIALTQRLNERDEQIMALQDELDAYDKNQAALENKLDEKTAQCIHLQRISLEKSSRDFGSSDNAGMMVKLRRELEVVRSENALEQSWCKNLLGRAARTDRYTTATHEDVLPLCRDGGARIDELTNLLKLRDKERKAVQAIFEKKIVVLVDGISNTLVATGAKFSDTSKAAALKDLNSLRKLSVSTQSTTTVLLEPRRTLK